MKKRDTKIRIRQWKMKDLKELLKIDSEIWNFYPATWEMFESRLKTFPQGQILAEVDGRIAGWISTMRICADKLPKNFSWDEITDYGRIVRTHQPKGETLYGVGLAVKREFHGKGVSGRLIIAGGQLAIRLNLKQILLGARVPFYHKYAADIPIEEYIFKSIDPELHFYRKYGCEVVRVLPGYIFDPQSLNFGVLVRWKNPFYRKPLLSSLGWRLVPYLIKYLIK